MPKPMYVWTGTAWVSVASEVESLATYATQSYADNLPGSKLIVPSSVAVGSGSGSISTQGTITFTGASSISINGCFSSAYDEYKITIQETASGNVALYWRGRTSGTDNSNSNYDWRTFYNDRTTLAVNTGTDNTSSAQFSDTGSSRSSHILEVINPFLSQPTQVFSRNYISDGNGYVKYGGSQFDTTTSFDGITFYLGSGTFSGTIRIYGYKVG